MQGPVGAFVAIKRALLIAIASATRTSSSEIHGVKWKLTNSKRRIIIDYDDPSLRLVVVVRSFRMKYKRIGFLVGPVASRREPSTFK